MKINMFVVSILIFCLVLCSCSINIGNLGRYFKSDQQIARERLDLLLSSLQNKDRNALSSLFSEKSIKDAKDFQNNIDKLFEYFEGTNIKYDDYSPLNIENKRDGNLVKKTIYSSYDVQTETQTYRIAIQDIITNTYEKDNVGFYSIYIIILSEDTDPQYTYRGDGNDTPGINIGIKNVIMN